MAAFLQNAHRIRDLEVGDWHHGTAYEILHQLFGDVWKKTTKLRTLQLWLDGSPAQFESCRRLLSPTISQLGIRLPWNELDPHKDAHSWSTEHEAFFTDMARMVGNLEVFYLQLGVSSLWPLFEERVFSLLSKMPYLKEIYLPTTTLSPTFVTRCATLHNVNCIRSSDDCGFPNPRNSPYEEHPWYNSSRYTDMEATLTKAVPSLDQGGTTHSADRPAFSQLAVCSDAVTIGQFVQRTLDVKILTRLDLALVRAPTIDGLRNALRIVGRDSLDLREFRLAAPDAELDSINPLRLGYLERDVARLEWRVLAPLLACTRMEVFMVNWDTSVLVTEEEIEELARTWPHLRTLHLYAGRPHPSNPLERTPSMSVLATLSRHCPDLASLTMQLSPVAPGKVPTDFRPLKYVNQPIIIVGSPAPDDGPTLIATYTFLSQILPPECPRHFATFYWHAVELNHLDPAETSPHNAAEWRQWKTEVREFRAKLDLMWRERNQRKALNQLE